TSGSSAPGAITSFTLSQVRLSVLGSRARYFQKLLTSGTLRVFLMSSKTARTCGEASAYSIGGGVDMSHSGFNRHTRPRAGHPRLTISAIVQDVDGIRNSGLPELRKCNCCRKPDMADLR